MVDHARKLVRDAAVTDLTGLTTTGANVFTSRVSPLESGEIPGMYIMLRDEDADLSSAIGTFERAGQLIIEAWAAGGDGLEDKLDTIAAEVEAAIYANAGALQALIMNYGPPRTQLDLSGEGAARLGKLRILFPVTYRTSITDPTTIV